MATAPGLQSSPIIRNLRDPHTLGRVAGFLTSCAELASVESHDCALKPARFEASLVAMEAAIERELIKGIGGTAPHEADGDQNRIRGNLRSAAFKVWGELLAQFSQIQRYVANDLHCDQSFQNYAAQFGSEAERQLFDLLGGFSSGTRSGPPQAPGQIEEHFKKLNANVQKFFRSRIEYVRSQLGEMQKMNLNLIGVELDIGQAHEMRERCKVLSVPDQVLKQNPGLTPGEAQVVASLCASISEAYAAFEVTKLAPAHCFAEGAGCLAVMRNDIDPVIDLISHAGPKDSEAVRSALHAFLRLTGSIEELRTSVHPTDESKRLVVLNSQPSTAQSYNFPISSTAREQLVGEAWRYLESFRGQEHPNENEAMRRVVGAIYVATDLLSTQMDMLQIRTDRVFHEAAFHAISARARSMRTTGPDCSAAQRWEAQSQGPIGRIEQHLVELLGQKERAKLLAASGALTFMVSALVELRGMDRDQAQEFREPWHSFAAEFISKPLPKTDTPVIKRQAA